MLLELDQKRDQAKRKVLEFFFSQNFVFRPIQETSVLIFHSSKLTQKWLILSGISYPTEFFTPTPRVCTDGWAYGHVITKISRMDGLPNFLSVGLRPRARRTPLYYTVSPLLVNSHN